MKRTAIITVVAFAISSTAFSQGIYVRAGGGFGLPVATSTLGERFLEIYDESTFQSTSSAQIVTGSHGAGMNFQVAFGYKFNENLIFDLDVRYVAGNKIETSDIYQITGGQNNQVSSTIYSTRSGGVFFNPSVVFSAGFGKRAPYGRFGFVTGSPFLTEKIDDYNSSDDEFKEITWKYRKGIAFGYQAAVGLKWELSEKLDVYAELNFINMTWSAKEAEMTKYNNNGVDELSLLETYFKKKVFEKTYDPVSEQQSFDTPNVEPRKSYPFSSLGAQAGIRFSLWQVKK